MHLFRAPRSRKLRENHFLIDKTTQAYVPRQSMKAEVAADIRAIFNVATRHGAEALLAAMVKKYEERA